MTNEKIKSFRNDNYSKPPEKNYPTNETVVNHADDVWSLDILDLKDFGPENYRNYRYILVIIDIFSKFRWTVPLKKK